MVLRSYKGMRIIYLIVFTVLFAPSHAQIDSLARTLSDSLKNLLIDESIPKKTFADLFLYPHRWYVKQLLKPRVPYYDTSYITSHKKKLNIALAGAKKYYGFNFIDLATAQTLKYLPNTPYHIGFNFSNIIATFGFYPGIKFGAAPGRGSTSSRDYQLTVIGKHVSADINYQRYRGMYSFKAKSGDLSPLPTWDPLESTCRHASLSIL